MTRLVAAVAGALVCVAIAVPLVLRIARRLGLLDHPNNRSSHTVATPRGGGLPIVLVTVVGSLLLAGADLRGVRVFCATGSLVALVGWIDDRVSLPALLRLLVHAGAAAAVLVSIGVIDRLPAPGAGDIALGPLALPLTLLWLVGLTNAYNFMDGIDGIAAGQGALSGLLWAVAGTVAGLPDVALIGALLAGACLGFLPYNWSPARIFMGDVGSGFLGLTFALLTVLAVVRSGDPRFAVAGALFVGVFVFDTGFTFLRRAWRRENVLRAHRTHLYQRLVAQGHSHRQVALGCLGLGAVLGGCGLAVLRGTSSVAAAALSAAVLLLFSYWMTVSVLERRADGRQG